MVKWAGNMTITIKIKSTYEVQILRKLYWYNEIW